MNLIEAAVIVFGVFAGYWVVSKLFFRAPGPGNPRRAGSSPGGAADAPPWHQVLQVPEQASEPEIRDAYKALMSQYHPDKVAHLGDELRELAHRKTQQINAALRDGLAARGVRP